MANESKAIVIGGSMAGMMAARVLSDRFDKVIIIERDTIPDEAVARNGVPQGRHLHLLLARGQEVMEDFFPGLSDDLTEAGSPILTWGIDTLLVTPGGHTQKYDLGIRSNVTSRISLEHIVRQRILKIGNIAYVMNAQVNQLLEDSDRIVGVEIMNRKTKLIETLVANLVVDASGRGSKAPEWLLELGYETPDETEINSFLGYATRWYEVPEGYTPDYLITTVFPDYKNQLYRGGGILFAENNKAIVTLAGVNKDYPPTDEAEFLEFAKSLPSSYIYNFVKKAKPISPIYGYQRTKNRIRHYEKLSRRPENFIILGDAYCCFNPVYGQGMTVAALEVDALRDVLKNYSVQDLNGFAEKFQKRLPSVIQNAWEMATSEDLKYPLTEGSKPSIMLRIMQIYSTWMLETCVHDTVIGTTFAKMMNLQVSGIAALNPIILARVLWHKFIRPKPHRQLDPSINTQLPLTQPNV